MLRAIQLYTFLAYCNDSPLEREVLECGAGVWSSSEPLLVRFHKHDYVTHGIEISDERLAAANEYAQARGMDLDIRQGDMRDLPFADGSMSFVFSYNTIFHMTKAEVAVAMGEIRRVLKPEGLCFVNFLSVDSDTFGTGREIGQGEFVEMEGGEESIHVYYEDDEPDEYFGGLELLHKEKRIRTQWVDGRKYVRAYVDYIARKA